MEYIKFLATSCSGGSFFGLPTWYAYLRGSIDKATNQCTPVVNNINDIWLIVAAIIEMLLRIAGIVAVFMVIYGGVEFITSQGNPEKAAKARNTLMYSLIGLLIAVSAAVLVTFVATSLGA